MMIKIGLMIGMVFLFLLPALGQAQSASVGQTQVVGGGCVGMKQVTRVVQPGFFTYTPPVVETVMVPVLSEQICVIGHTETTKVRSRKHVPWVAFPRRQRRIVERAARLNEATAVTLRLAGC